MQPDLTAQLQNVHMLATETQVGLLAHVEECGRNYIRVEKMLDQLRAGQTLIVQTLLAFAGASLAVGITVGITIWAKLH